LRLFLCGKRGMRTLGFVTAKRFRSVAEKVIAKRFRRVT